MAFVDGVLKGRVKDINHMQRMIALNAIVFDLELIKRFRKGQLSQIVEIGACKVNLESKRMIDQFQIYISPKSGYIAKSTRKFINMSKEDAQSAVPFHQGIHRFANWLGKEYFLCSWGRDDRFHLINQCVRQRIPLDWLKNYNNLQQQIGHVLRPNVKQQLGLKQALELAGIEPTGKAHRGIDDAINTAELLIRFADQIKLQKNVISPKDLAEHETREADRKVHRSRQTQISQAGLRT